MAKYKSPLQEFMSKKNGGLPEPTYLDPSAGINGNTSSKSTYNPEDYEIKNEPKSSFLDSFSVPKAKHYKTENGKYIKDANGKLVEYTDEEWNEVLNKENENKIATKEKENQWREENKAPSQVFGDEAYDYFKKRMEHETGKNYDDNKLLGDLLYVLDAPSRFTPTNRILDTAQKSIVGEDGYYVNPYSKDTGNGLANAGLDIVGGMLGMGAMPTGDGNTTMLNFSDDMAAMVGKKATEKTGSNLLGAVTRGAVDGAVGGAGQNLAVKGGQDIEDDIISGAVGGGLFGGGFNLLGKGINKVKGGIDQYNTGRNNSNIGLLGKLDNSDLENVSAKEDITHANDLTPTLNKGVVENNNTLNNNILKTDIENNNVNTPKFENVFETNVPLKERNLSNVSSKKVNAMQYDYPELQPYIKRAAMGLDFELRNSTIKGESVNTYTPEGEFNGRLTTPKQASETIHAAQQQGMSYDKIQKAIDDLIEDNGKENNANAKKLEQILDNELTNGSKTVEGYDIPANQDYVQTKKDIMDIEEGTFDYSKPNYSNTDTPTIKNQPSMALEIESPRTIEKGNSLDIEIDPSLRRNIPDGMDVSKTHYNTYRNADMLQNPNVQKVVDDVNDLYNVKSNEQSLNRANEMLSTDYEGTKTRIMQNGISSAEDSAASAVIAKNLTHDFLKTGDSTELKAYLEAVRPEITNLAQSLQAFSIWKNLSPEGTLLKAQRVVDNIEQDLRSKNPGKFKKIDAEIDAKVKEGVPKTKAKEEVFKTNNIPTLDDSDISFITKTMSEVENMSPGRQRDIEIAKVKKLIADKTPSTLVNKARTYQMVNLLLNTKTMTRNVLGNVGMMALENIKDIPGALLDRGISALTKTSLGENLDDSLRGQRTTEGLTMDRIKVQVEGLVEGLKNTLEDHKLGIDTSKAQGQFELPQAKSFKSDGNAAERVMSKLEDLTTTGLKVGDTPFFEAAYKDSLNQQMKFKNVSEPTEEMINKAIDYAKDKTFQNESELAKAFKSVQKALNKLIGKDDFGLGNIVIPFTKTPANITDKAIDYSPIGGAKGVYNLVKGLKSGNLDQKTVVDQLGRSLTGMSIMALGSYLYNQGIITAQGPSDYEAQQLEKQSGKTPYSLKIGNKYYSIDWMQPAAIPLMIGADVAENSTQGQDFLSNLIDGVATGASTLANQSLLQGIAKLFGGYSSDSGENFMKGVLDTFLEAPQQFVPLNSTLKQVNDFVDPYSRETYSSNKVENEWNKIKSKLPGLSQTLPKKIDTMGNEVLKYPTTEGNPILSTADKLFNPGKISEFLPSNSEKVALELYNESGATKQMPRLAQNKISYQTEDGKETINLTGEEKAKLQRLIGQATEEAFSDLPSNYYDVSSERRENYLKDELTRIYREAEDEILKDRGITRYK